MNLNLNHDLIGRHCSIDDFIDDLIVNVNHQLTNCPQKPIQICLPRHIPLFQPPNNQIINNLKILIAKTNVKFYIHSDFQTNLSRPFSNKSFYIQGVKRALAYGKLIGSSGVVVHTGNSLKLDPKQGILNMKNNIDHLLQFATKSCPLLLETPAGQGTQQLVKFEDFFEFYLQYKDDNRIKVCVDTAHVFAADYDPYEYLDCWLRSLNENSITNSIGLIHFNDSEVKRNSRRDKHAYPGNGLIGANVLNQVLSLALKYKIPMIIEA